MTPEIEALLENPRKFLKSIEMQPNDNWNYLFQTKDERILIKLDFILSDYYDWLIENKLVIPVNTK